jgi:hypothetical protein
MPRNRPMPRQTFDSIWTWVYRGVQISLFIGGVLWFAFQFYSDVGGLKIDVSGLKVTTMELTAGQKATHDKLDQILANQPPKAP